MLRNVPVSVRDLGAEAMLGRTWIDPIGGYGDILMISGVLKQAIDRDPSRRFHLVTRTRFTPLLKGHPAIDLIGHPPPGANLVKTDYWDEPGFHERRPRAYQVLARRFGLPTPCPELLWIPTRAPLDPGLAKLLPPGPRVLISVSSESPRKVWPPARFAQVVRRLAAAGLGVVQVGHLADPYIHGARDLRGMTRVAEVPALVAAMDAVLTADNYIMHAAAMEGVPGVVVWGPTRAEVYGYPLHRHLQAEPDCPEKPSCIGPQNPKGYQTACPEGERHCVAALSVEDVLAALAALRPELAAAARA